MRLAEAVVGLRQAVALHVAGRRASCISSRDPAPDRATGRAARAADLVERPAEEVLRDHVHAAARGEEACGFATWLASTAMSIALLPMPTTTTRLPRSRRRRRSGARASARPSNVSRRGRRARASAGPSGGRWRRAARRRCGSRRCRASTRQVPSLVALGVLHAGLERDPLAEAEVIDVVVEVARDLACGAGSRDTTRHREVRVLHAVARRVDVRRSYADDIPLRLPKTQLPPTRSLFSKQSKGCSRRAAPSRRRCRRSRRR